MTSDPQRPRLVLRLSGEAIAALELRPRQLCWGNLRMDSAQQRTVQVVFRPTTSFKVQAVLSSSPLFSATVASADPAAPALIKVQTLPPLAPGSFQATLTILTDQPRFDSLALNMHGRVLGALYTLPEELVLAPNNQSLSQSLWVYADRRRRFKILRVEPPCADIAVKIRTSWLRNAAQVELNNIRPLPELDGSRVIIFTDLAAMPELVVPIRIRAKQPNTKT